MDYLASTTCHGIGQQGGSLSIEHPGALLIGLCLVHCSISSTVDDEVNLVFLHGRLYGCGIGDVKLGYVGKEKNASRAIGRKVAQLSAQLTVCSSNKYLHSIKIPVTLPYPFYNNRSNCRERQTQSPLP